MHVVVTRHHYPLPAPRYHLRHVVSRRATWLCARPVFALLGYFLSRALFLPYHGRPQGPHSTPVPQTEWSTPPPLPVTCLQDRVHASSEKYTRTEDSKFYIDHSTSTHLIVDGLANSVKLILKCYPFITCLMSSSPITGIANLGRYKLLSLTVHTIIRYEQ